MITGVAYLSVADVRVEFPTPDGPVRALDGVSLQVSGRETVAVVGESGCGKTTLARAILGLQPTVGGSIAVGSVPVRGPSRNLAERVGIVWQDPYASLNPKWKVRRSIAEPFTVTGKRGDVDRILGEVGLDPEHGDRYPHQLSGGQRQRVAIARALALRPPLVILDEPTAALDLSIQAQILNLLRDLQQDLGCAYLYISHDLVTVRYLADRVAVMYLGRIVEEGPTADVFERPRHPYTKILLDSAPTLERIGFLPDPIAGEIPSPGVTFTGCRFASRCPRASEMCRTRDPSLVRDESVAYACHHPLAQVHNP